MWEGSSPPFHSERRPWWRSTTKSHPGERPGVGRGGLWNGMEARQQTAKSLQSCPTLCDPIDGSPPGSPVPGILQARTLEWVAISFSNAWRWKVKVKSLSPIQLLATPWTTAYQAPLSIGFSRQEYWSGVPLPSPGSRGRLWTKEIQIINVASFVNSVLGSLGTFCLHKDKVLKVISDPRKLTFLSERNIKEFMISFSIKEFMIPFNKQ